MTFLWVQWTQLKIDSSVKSGRVKGSGKLANKQHQKQLIQNQYQHIAAIGQNLCELGQRQTENIGRRNNAAQRAPTAGGVPFAR